MLCPVANFVEITKYIPIVVVWIITLVRRIYSLTTGLLKFSNCIVVNERPRVSDEFERFTYITSM